MAEKMFGISLHDQRAKYLLVAVLAAILLAVIAWPGDAPPAESGAAAAVRTPRNSTPARDNVAIKTEPQAFARTTGKKSVKASDAARLSEDELELTLSYNPFVPSALLQAQIPGSQMTATEQQVQKDLAEKAQVLAAEQRLSEFRGKKVRVVFRTADGSSAAIIGDKLLVREGEVIDGVRILSISSDGVVVEAMPPQRGVGF